MSIVVWYLVISYLVVMTLFFVDFFMHKNTASFPILLAILLFAPITMWHGILYYVAMLWCKWRNVPFKPWI